MEGKVYRDFKKFKRIFIFALILIAALIVVLSSFSIISPTERGVRVTLGKAGDTVLQPGLVLKYPFIQSVRKYDLSPKQLMMNFSKGADAAVTSDMQSVACNIVVYWIYDESRIVDIINGYSETSLRNLVRDNTLGAIKEVIGKYEIYEIIAKQDDVTSKVMVSLLDRLESHPVTLRSVTINNWDWSEDFDAQIAKTMAMKQQVNVAQQELEVTKQNTQKQVAEATAARQKAEIEAAMKVAVAEQEALAREAEARGFANAAKIKAEGEAEARKIAGEAEASYYNSLKPYTDVIKATRDLDIQEVRAGNWNGVEVPTYLPLTAGGTLVSLE